MAVVGVHEDDSGDSERTLDERTANRVFVVTFGEGTGSPLLSETANDGTRSIPALGSSYPGDSTRKAIKVRARPNGGTKSSYVVTVEYSDIGNEWLENPLSKPDDISWDTSEATEEYFFDTQTSEDFPDGKPTVNSAGEPFEKIFPREKGTLTATVRRNVASFNPMTELAINNKVNEDTFTLDGATIPVGKAKIWVKCGGKQKSNGVTFREKIYTIKLQDTWDDEVDDRGFNAWDIILDEEGEPTEEYQLFEITKGSPPTRVDKPWPLNGVGQAMPLSTDAPVKLTFKPYYRASYASLGFS